MGEKITIAGAGYVGLSLGVLLSKKNDVTITTRTKEKADLINSGISPIKDKEISEYLAKNEKKPKAVKNSEDAYKNARIVIIAVPTDYSDEKSRFDTQAVEETIKTVMKVDPEALIVIKSTVPAGYTEGIAKKYNNPRIIFSPEFLREGKALYDNLHPSRIIVGTDKNSEIVRKEAENFALLLKSCAHEENVPVLITNNTEAECIKLFSNAYLAMRICFFNEVDTYAEIKGLDPEDIIEGVCMDERIGMHYNNPSFGYGGYCLPKDTRQLLENCREIPNKIIKAVVDANNTRKDHVSETIISKVREHIKTDEAFILGIYRLAMKKGSDNFRHSSIKDILIRLQKEKMEMIIYEPLIKEKEFNGIPVSNDIDGFKSRSCMIIANRMDDELKDVKEKVYTRDIFCVD